MVTLKSVLDGKLQEYNESNPMMDLVLFDQAMVSDRAQNKSRALAYRLTMPASHVALTLQYAGHLFI